MAKFSSRRTEVTLVVVFLATLILSLLLKLPCARHAWGGFEYHSWCYNDIMALYGLRHFDQHAFPYLTTNLEYPVGIGLLAGLAGWLAQNLSSFFGLTSIVLIFSGLVSLWCLKELSSEPSRLIRFVVAPTLILYAFLNWDLVPVALLLLGLVAYQRQRDGWAGFWLGLGAATKVFPGLLVPGLLVDRYLRKRYFSWSLLFGAVVGFVGLNLPIVLTNPSGWWYPWQFQANRFPNFETIWFIIYHQFGKAEASSFWWTIYPRLTSSLSLGLFGVGLSCLLVAEWRARRVRPWVVAFITLVIFLLTAKIFSPQYLLWLLPFFVLLPFSNRQFLAFEVVDLATWAAIAHYLPWANSLQGTPALALLELAVVVRYGMLVWLGLVAYCFPIEGV